MEQDFFQEAQYEQVENHNEPNHEETNNTEQQNYQWGNNTPALELGNSGSAAKIDAGSYSKIQIDDETTNKIRQEEQKIQQILRQKGNKEYEDKSQRKQKGRLQLEEFFANKEKQKDKRKQQNIQHENKLIQNNKKMNEGSGWIKVSQNVNLKQGEYKGAKSIQRMRESIINKTSDQKQE